MIFCVLINNPFDFVVSLFFRQQNFYVLRFQMNFTKQTNFPHIHFNIHPTNIRDSSTLWKMKDLLLFFVVSQVCDNSFIGCRNWKKYHLRYTHFGKQTLTIEKKQLRFSKSNIGFNSLYQWFSIFGILNKKRFATTHSSGTRHVCWETLL